MIENTLTAVEQKHVKQTLADMEGFQGLYYFAHPYTVRDARGNWSDVGVEAQFNHCCIRTAELFHRGFNVYSPIAHTHPVHIRSTETIIQNFTDPEFWYRVDNHLICAVGDRWSGLILAPGWQQSKGCVGERYIIEYGLEKDVFYYDSIVSDYDPAVCPDCYSYGDACSCGTVAVPQPHWDVAIALQMGWKGGSDD